MTKDRQPVEPYEWIYQRIVEGDFEPGQRLIEQRIAEDLEISRTPVREALRRLEAAGLIVTERNRGAIVRHVSRDELVDLYQLRSRLEALASERAADRATPEEVAAMREASDHYLAAIPTTAKRGVGAIRELARWNRILHDLIIDAARHARLAELLKVTVDAPLVFRSFQTFEPGDHARSGQFHQLIVEAIAAGDGPRAGRLMTEHIDQGRDVLLRSLDRQGQASTGRRRGAATPK